MVTWIIIVIVLCLAYLFAPQEEKANKNKAINVKRKLPVENNVLVPKNKLFTHEANRLFSENFEPILSDKVNLWKSATGIINVYAPGSMLGSGLIGEFNNRDIALHLENKFPYSATIIGSENNKLLLEIILEDHFPALDKLTSIQKTKYLTEIQKLYNPKSSWDIYFILKPEVIDKTNVMVKCNILDEINLINFDKNIWIEDINGTVISEINKSETASTIRTIRALYSNCNISIKFNHDKLGYACFSIIPNPISEKN